MQIDEITLEMGQRMQASFGDARFIWRTPEASGHGDYCLYGTALAAAMGHCDDYGEDTARVQLKRDGKQLRLVCRSWARGDYVGDGWLTPAHRDYWAVEEAPPCTA